jgi:ribulose-phosphate 3-epimerase
VKLLRKSCVIPTVFSRNKKEFFSRLNSLLGVSKNLQIDFMDGFFVRGKSVLPRFVPSLTSFSNVFEAHLMVSNPRAFFVKIKDKGFKKIIFHLESFKVKEDALLFYKDLKKKGFVPVLAVNPDTVLSKNLIKSFDFFLVMGVHPGKEKQSLIPSTFSRIRFIKSVNPSAKVQVDGGVNPSNSSKLFKAGADYINSGSYISDNEDPEKALLSLLN